MLGPPPTSKYFWLEDVAADVDNARSRASSRDNSFVGVEMARDFGRTLLGEESVYIKSTVSLRTKVEFVRSKSRVSQSLFLMDEI